MHTGIEERYKDSKSGFSDGELGLFLADKLVSYLNFYNR